MDAWYHTLRLLRVFLRYTVIGAENIPPAGPALYVGNHLGSLGPVVTVLSVPVRFYPWVIADQLDPRRSPRYLYDEFARPTLNLSNWPGLAVSTMISWISVPLLTRLGGIPVDRSSGWTGGAFRKSLGLLGQNKNLLIFPEDPKKEMDPETRMCPFMNGFAELCRLYQNAAGVALPVYPVTVHPGRKVVVIAEAVFYRASHDWRQAIHMFTEQVQQQIGQLYCSLSQQQRTGPRFDSPS